MRKIVRELAWGVGGWLWMGVIGRWGWFWLWVMGVVGERQVEWKWWWAFMWGLGWDVVMVGRLGWHSLLLVGSIWLWEIFFDLKFDFRWYILGVFGWGLVEIGRGNWWGGGAILVYWGWGLVWELLGEDRKALVVKRRW